MTDDLVTRLRGWITVPTRSDHMGRVTEFHEVRGVRIFDEAANEIERLRTALARAVGELSTYGNMQYLSPEQLMQQFLDEADAR